MLTIECAYCGKPFMAKRSTARYCSVNHRVAAHEARKRAPSQADDAPKALPARREGAQVIALPPVKPSVENGFVLRTKRLLEEAGQADSYAGMSAVFAAEILDSGVQDTMSSMATMLKEYKASMKEALASVRQTQSPLDEIREALKLA